MFNKLIDFFVNNFKNLDKLALIIMRFGLKFCALLGLFALIILSTYTFSLHMPILFSIGFILFKLSLTFGVEFIICGFAVSKIKTDYI